MCMATGVPAPTISWFRNGLPFSGDSTTHVITGSTDDSTALLSVTHYFLATSVMRESAFTIITCTASNGVGANSSDSTQLIVLCKYFVLKYCGMCVNPLLQVMYIQIHTFCLQIFPVPCSCSSCDFDLSRPRGDLPRPCLLQLHCRQLPSLQHHLAPQWG